MSGLPVARRSTTLPERVTKAALNYVGVAKSRWEASPCGLFSYRDPFPSTRRLARSPRDRVV